MRKKLILLVVLIVCLFIYIGRANAVVMWMQCTAGENDLYIQNRHPNADRVGVGNFAWDVLEFAGIENLQDAYAKYNTIVTINGYHSTSGVKRVFYVGGNEGVSTRFFDVHGPVYFAQREGHRADKFDNNVCWYKNDGGSFLAGGDDMTECEEDDNIGFLDPSEIDKGFCPEALYITTGGNTGGATKGDFIVATGKTQAPVSPEVLNGYKLVIYKTKTQIDTNMWVMEVYNNAGIYAAMYGISFQEFLDSLQKYKPKDNAEKVVVNGLLIAATDKRYAFYIPSFLLGVPGISNYEYGEAHAILTSDYLSDAEFVDWTQHTLLVKLSKLGKNFYKITESDKYPEVLLGNITEQRVISNTVRNSSAGDKTYWKEVKEWLDDNNSFIENDEEFSKFNEGKEYGDLIADAEKATEAFDSQNKYDLSKEKNGAIDFQSYFDELEGAYTIIEKLAYNAGYEKRNPDCKISEDKSNDSTESLRDSVSCQIFGKPFTNMVADSAFDSEKLDDVIIEVFSQSLEDQLNILIGNNNSLLNHNGILKDYTIKLLKLAYYIKTNYSEELSGEQMERLNSIISNYAQLARNKYGAEVIVDCDTLLGEDFLNKIGKYVDIIKIAIPIILIGFGVLDFSKAVFAGNDDEMKKAQKKFLMRIVIAVLFFLLPFILKILLSIANKAWYFISPNSCNIIK